MATKEIILGKLQSLITENFEKPEAAFKFFDNNGDSTLSKKEIVKLLKEAKISGVIRGLVATKLIEGYSKDGDSLVSWEEFQTALDEIAD